MGQGGGHASSFSEFSLRRPRPAARLTFSRTGPALPRGPRLGRRPHRRPEPSLTPHRRRYPFPLSRLRSPAPPLPRRSRARLSRRAPTSRPCSRRRSWRGAPLRRIPPPLCRALSPPRGSMRFREHSPHRVRPPRRSGSWCAGRGLRRRRRTQRTRRIGPGRG